jgi:hypothetical protein
VRKLYGPDGYERRWNRFPQPPINALRTWLKFGEEMEATSALGGAIIDQLLFRDTRRSVAIAAARRTSHEQVVATLRELAARWNFDLVERPEDGPDAVEAVPASFSPELQQLRDWLIRNG